MKIDDFCRILKCEVSDIIKYTEEDADEYTKIKKSRCTMHRDFCFRKITCRKLLQVFQGERDAP